MQIKCDECNTTFNRKSSLTRHRQNFHRPNKAHLRCEQCLKAFSRRDLLQRHERLHRGDGLTACWLCSRPIRPDYLPTHIEICLRKASQISYNSPFRFARALRSSSMEESWAQPLTDLKWKPPITSFKTHEDQPEEARTPTAATRRVEQPVRVLKGEQISVISTRLKECADVALAIERNVLPLLKLKLNTFASKGLTLTNVDALFQTMRRRSLLGYACEEGSDEVVRFLLRRNIDVNQKDVFKRTSLYYACARGELEIVKLLLSAGANVELVGRSDTALCTAARGDQIDIAIALLDVGAKIDGGTDDGELSPLFVACFHNNLESAELFIRRGAKINTNGEKCLPLDAALRWGSLELVTLLLGFGARVDLVDHNLLARLREQPRPGWFEFPFAGEKLRLLDQYAQPLLTNNNDITPLLRRDVELLSKLQGKESEYYAFSPYHSIEMM